MTTRKNPCPHRCVECRKGPAFRLDVTRVKGEDYRCNYCPCIWRLVGTGPFGLRKRHEHVVPA